MSVARSRVLAVLAKHARRPSHSYSYGTAGFRFEVDDYSPLVFARTGLVAFFRSAWLGGRTVGLCITASHNLEKDNGVKLVDPDGGMLAQDWEQLAAQAINAQSDEESLRVLEAACGGSAWGNSSVLLARDTRAHSHALEQCALEVILACGGQAESLGECTTPQLHYCVMQRNNNSSASAFPPTLQGYEDLICHAYQELTEGTAALPGKLVVDCSNGIGARSFRPIATRLSKHNSLQCELVNTGGDRTDGKLNLGCGAEYVQKGQQPPGNLPPPKEKTEQVRYASFDGDADRVVCFYFDKEDDGGMFRLLDGDKIASLLALFCQKQLAVLGLLEECTVGTVQTAYANGSSTAFLERELVRVQAPKVKTGVKHLHHRALDYDVGVYFEANGHGTALFSGKLVAQLTEPQEQGPKEVARKRLLALTQLLNQATGDAIADVLAVDAVLRVLGFASFAPWNALYQDLPSKQIKVPCADRGAVEVNEDETRCTEPAALQHRLDELVQQRGGGRVFCRPSGTENVIRVYAEAETQQDADWLAEGARQAICDFAGGVDTTTTTSKKAKVVE